MAGHGISYGGSKFVNYRAEEHGFFITMLNARPRTKYMQGLSRMWTRTTPLDYAWPTFAQLGEQETKNKELYLSGDPEYDEGTFGYLLAMQNIATNLTVSQAKCEPAMHLGIWHVSSKFSLH